MATSVDPAQPPVRDVAEFGELYSSFMRQMMDVSSGRRELSEIGHVVREELGHDPLALDVAVESFESHQLADVEAAVQQVAGQHEMRWVGLRSSHIQHVDSLADFIGRTFGDSTQVGALARARVTIGAGQTRSVVSFGLVFATMPAGRVACLLRAPNPQFGRNELRLDLMAVREEAVSEFIALVREQLDRRSVLAGQVISLQRNPFDHYGADSPLQFLARPEVSEDQVVLPDGVLARITRHVVGIREHRDALLNAGQHLKRGVLLYGPPGTGKTHIVRHLISSSPGVTAILLTGQTLQFISVATQLARATQPALIVLEDCDLVAEERGGDTNAALFDTLEAIDGLDGDADIAFVLTTNRPDLLERALVERPGRVDLAVQIDRPDEVARAALLRLYSPAEAPFTEELLARVAARTEGATASFAKELMRRTVLLAATEQQPVAEGHLLAACEEMLSDGEAFTRSLLGGGSTTGG